MATPAEHIAEAYRKMAKANHYLVTVTGTFTIEEFQAAEQILISLDNAANNADKTLNLALDLIEIDIAREQRRPSDTCRKIVPGNPG